MKSRITKIISVLLCAVVLLSMFAACGGGGSTKQTTGSTQSGSATTGGTAATTEPGGSSSLDFPIVSKPITLTAMTPRAAVQAEFATMYVWNEIEKLTNIHIEWLEVPAANIAEKRNLAITSGEFLTFSSNVRLG